MKKEDIKNELDYSALWKAVVVRSIIDHFLFDYKNKEPKNWNEYYKKNIAIKNKNYLKTENFKLVCDYAQVDYNFIMKNIKDIYKRLYKKKIY